MPIALASSGTIAATATSTSLAVDLPPGIAANDICLWHSHAQKSTLGHSYPAGWTVVGPVIEQSVSTRTIGISFAWRRMDGSTSGQVTFSHSGASTCVAMSAISLWRGVSTTGTPYSTQVSTLANSSIYNSEGVSVASTDHMLVVLGSNTDDQAAMAAMSSGSGVSTSMTLGYSTESALGNGSILSMFYSQVLTSGTVQAGTIRMGTIEPWGAFEIALAASTETIPFNPSVDSFSVLGVQ